MRRGPRPDVAVVCCEAEAFEVEGAAHDYLCPGVSSNELRLKVKREKDRVRQAADREFLYSIRVVIDGRLTAVPDPRKPGDVVNHGRAVTYMRRGCRCLLCNAAKTVKDRQDRAKRART